ncbi:hypothetical protein RI129_000540 [Pyrocoelia pectoralis]|uniref:Uncharacterized protein n=1 Tax=Pyrocoelia pectoralis TaxID=417401 RepID=A0AAN7VRM9_9COLE
MIDWVSIVRHSRRRFSNYMYGVPNKVRRRRRHKRPPADVVASPTDQSKSSCCWAEKLEKARYATEDDMPPPPSPPKIRETILIDGITRQSSLERGLQRKVSLDREPNNRDISKVLVQNFLLMFSR